MMSSTIGRHLVFTGLVAAATLALSPPLGVRAAAAPQGGGQAAGQTGIPSRGEQQGSLDANPQRMTSTPYVGDLSIFESPGRDQRLQINRVMDLLGITPGKTVADIGAGSGWFTVRAARRVGPGGTIFAEDINPKAIETIADRARKEQLGNIRTILGTPDDVKLPAASVDAVLLLKVYHEIAHPALVMRELRASLKPGGRIGIIDRNGNGADHGLDRAVVEKEMAADGFALKEKYDFTKADGQDYFLIFIAK